MFSLPLSAVAVLGLLGSSALAAPWADGLIVERDIEARATYPDVGSYTYDGCYYETYQAAWRILGTKTTQYTGMTLDSCAKDCSGFKYFGVEYGNQCYCGDFLFNNPSKLAETRCAMACNGNSGQKCGGDWSLSVYKLGAVTPPPAGADYTALGCYTDSRTQRTLTGTAVSSNANTIESCAVTCKDFAYFGLEYGVGCYCGNSITGAGKIATDGRCNMPCTGNSAQVCGGSDGLSIYQFKSKVVAPESTALGCYADSRFGRTLTGKNTAATDMTPEKCAVFCDGFAYYGNEYGQECYCGNDLPASKLVTDGRCNMPCTGNSAQVCGGSDGLSMYKYKVAAPESTSVGCYSDNRSARTLTGKSFAMNSGMTLEVCANYCTDFKYFGTEFGVGCYCGNTLSSPGKLVTDGRCKMPCSGNSNQVCGGSDGLSVYQYKRQAAASTSLGCYTDSRFARSLTGKSQASPDNTPEQCAQFCNGYAYYGVEFGTGCYCGNTLGGSKASSGCNMVCAGDSSKTCGGSDRLNVWQYSTSTTLPPLLSASTTKVATSLPITSPTSSSTKSTSSLTTFKTSGATSSSTKSTTTLKTTTTRASTTTKTTTSPTHTWTSYSTPKTTYIPAATATPGKRGLPYNKARYADPFLKAGSQVRWAYNWYQEPQSLVPGVNYVPMLWSNASDLTETWKINVEAAIKAGSTHLLGFNEPDFLEQANMTPKQAAEAWMKWMQPFAGRLKLGSPAITNGADSAGMGGKWMDNFLGECKKLGCTVDFLAVHWYDAAWNTGYFSAYFKGLHTRYPNYKIWITEFGGSGTDSEQATFLKTVMPWLDAQSWVERYAYFWAEKGYLLANNAATTTLSLSGQAYMSYTSKTIDPVFN